MTVSPPDDALKDVLKALRSENPTLGVAKLQTRLLIEHPEWSVSEKRVKKLLAAENSLVAPPAQKPEKSYMASGSNETVPDPKLLPSSKVINNLNVARWSKKIKVVDFGVHEGKGLVAIEEIKEGEDVWKEDPFIIAPEWDIYDLQIASHACSFCTTPLSGNALQNSLSCSSSSNARLPNAGVCSARFCNRLCISRAERIHPLLCPARNPASVPLLAFARKLTWMACHAVAQCIARVLMAHEQGRQSDLDESMRFLGALSQMGMEERWRVVNHSGMEPDRKTWKAAHTLTVQAFYAPLDLQNKKRLSKVLRKPIPENLAKSLFDFDSYLQALSRMSLNLEAHGGIYVLHSHLNHSCTPNISVRHLDTKTALARITLRAKMDIKPGEELLITYVNPELPLRSRRRELTPWMFGPCACARCVREEQEEGEGVEENNFPGIEEELRHGLGLL